MHAALSMRRFSLPGIHEPMRNDKVLDVWRKDSDTSQLVDGEIRCRDTSEAPDKSSGSPVVVLIGAAVMAIQIVALQSPGEVLETKSVVRAAAYVDRHWVVDEAIRVYVPDAGHGVHEGAPFSVAEGYTWATEKDVLCNWRSAISIVTAAIEHYPEVRKTGERERLEGALKPAITLPVDDIGELAVRNSSVDVAIRKKSVKLCRHGDREQDKTNKRQHRGSSLRHELFLPGG